MERFIKRPIVQYILYACNAAFAIFGFVLIIVGTKMIKSIGHFTKYPNAADIKTLPILVILLGFLLVAAAVYGTFGVYIENIIFLYIYAAVVAILFILQLAMISWIFVNISKHPRSMQELVLMAWQQNYPEYGFPMDVLQIQFNCCGRYDSSDYTSGGLKVPNSCCAQWILYDCPDKIYLTKPGCLEKFYDFWARNNDIIRFVGIVTALAEIVALFFTFHYVRELRDSSCSY